MTTQEAIKRIKEHCRVHRLKEKGKCPLITKALEMAIQALEYRTPKKPDTDTVNRGIDVSGEYDIEYNYVCPNCGVVVGNFETEDIWYDFCPNCGQALDWSND